MGIVELGLLALVFFLLIARSWMFGIIVLGFVWIAAAAFNPDLDSGTIWLIGCALGYLVGPDPIMDALPKSSTSSPDLEEEAPL
jgi:hypothetical protein